MNPILRSIRTAIDRCTTEMHDVRTSIVMTERSSILTFFALANSQNEIDKSIPLEYIVNPSSMSHVRGFSQTAQNCSFLLGFLMDRPDIFANVIKKSFKNPNFPFICRCVIPAIYGFFTSDELLDYATCFYRQVIEVTPGDVAIQVLEPLFVSSVTYRYRESVLNAFFNQFVAMILQTTKASLPNLYKFQAMTLLEILTNNSNLLPKQIHEIWCCIHDSKWSLDDMFKLFFKHFFLQIAFRYIQSHTVFEHFSNVVSHLVKMNSDCRKLFTQLASTNSVFRLPSLYSPFEEQYFKVAISIHDIKLLSKMLSLQGSLPDMLSPKEFDDINPVYEWHLLHASVFPRPRTLTKQNLEAEIFPANEEEFRNEINSLITMQLCANMCMSWQNIVDENNVFWGCYYYQVYVTNKMCEKISLNDLFNKLVANITNRQFCQKIFLISLEKHIAKNGLKLIEELNKMDRLWTKLITKNEESTKTFLQDLEQCKQSHATLIKDSVCRFSESEKMPLHAQFIEISKSISELMIINNSALDNQRIVTFLFNQRPRGLFKIVLILLHCAVKNAKFYDLCTKNEKEAWICLESALNFHLTADMELYGKYTTLMRVIFKYYPIQ